MMTRRTATRWLSANDRFKLRNGDWMSAGIITAVVLHAGLFALFPELNAAEIYADADASEVVPLPELELPPPPEPITRPAAPRIPDEPVADDLTIPETGFLANPVRELPPPAAGASPSEVPAWTPRDIEPALENPRDIERILEQRYPSSLREAGIGGSVTLYVFVDETGVPVRSQVQEASDYAMLDAAALEVVARMRFSPAMNRDRPVGVWVLQTITFRAR